MIEVSILHYFNKLKMENNLTNYSKIKFRLQVIIFLTAWITIFNYNFYSDHIFSLNNDNMFVNVKTLSFQLILSYLMYFTFKQTKRAFFQVKEPFALFPIFFFSNFFFLTLLLLANSLIIILIAMIGINLGLYIILFNNYQRTKLESGLKYFFLSMVAVILLYISIICIYSITSTMNILYIANILTDMLTYDKTLISILYIFILCVIFYKTGIFPSNFFLPEIYKGLSNFLFIYITLPLKAVFFSFLIRFCEFVVFTDSYN
jgi:NADH:ubiquinone oxidoreductase subunit 2 (subunit N)